MSQLQKQSFPLINSGVVDQLAQLGTGNSGPAVFYSRSFVTGVTKSLGKHTVKAGYVFRSLSVNVTNISSANGVFAFDSSQTSATSAKTTASGADTASLLLGFPSSGSVQTTTRLNGNIHYNAAYLQDDFRVTPQLTLNFGFRYEYEPGISETNNHTAVGFDPAAQAISAGALGSSTFTGAVELAGQNGYGTHCCNAGSKYAPRVGFAYAPTQHDHCACRLRHLQRTVRLHQRQPGRAIARLHANDHLCGAHNAWQWPRRSAQQSLPQRCRSPQHQRPAHGHRQLGFGHFAESPRAHRAAVLGRY